jgi:hypothetical protein
VIRRKTEHYLFLNISHSPERKIGMVPILSMGGDTYLGSAFSLMPLTISGSFLFFVVIMLRESNPVTSIRVSKVGDSGIVGVGEGVGVGV